MELQAALPRPMYVDPGHWSVEREAVLHREWFCVGRRDDLGLVGSNRAAVVDVAGESVVVTLDQTGELHAAYNVCRHRGSQVIPVPPGSGPVSCAAGSLRCPYHSWTYGLDGRLLRSPHADSVPADEFALHPVAVGEWAGFVLVHLTPGGETGPEQSLADATAPFDGRLAHYELTRLVTGAALDYEVAANYKVLLENYNECYHCGPVHPELSRLVPAFAGGGDGLDWEQGVEHREGAWTFTLSGTTERAPLPLLDEQERTRHKGELVYPNLLLSCSADHVAAFVLNPVAVDRTRVECRLLFDPDEAARPGFDPGDAVELWDLVNRQDWEICESVQRGMSSRAYTHGWFAPMEDDSLDIRRWLLPRLERGRG
jgi:glycine betaine catabolism A